MTKIGAIIDVLRYGKMLGDPVTWKNRQNAISALTSVLGSLIALLPLFGLTLEVSNEDILAIAGGVAAIGGVLNIYLTTATTDKIGVLPKSE